MRATVPHQEARLHIRASESQKSLLARAAKAKHLNVSQFVLQTCLEAAERVMHEQDAIPLIRVSEADYEWLIQKMAEPPKDLPELRKLLQEPTTWNA